MFKKLRAIDWRYYLTTAFAIIVVMGVIVGGVSLFLYIFQFIINWIMTLFA